MQTADFRTHLQDAINEKGVTQAWIAEKIGVTEATISRYLSGQTNPKTEFVIEIAKLLNVSTDFLLGLSTHSSPFPQESIEHMALIAAYERSDLHSKRIIWTVLDPYLSDNERRIKEESTT